MHVISFYLVIVAYKSRNSDFFVILSITIGVTSHIQEWFLDLIYWIHSLICHSVWNMHMAIKVGMLSKSPPSKIVAVVAIKML